MAFRLPQAFDIWPDPTRLSVLPNRLEAPTVSSLTFWYRHAPLASLLPWRIQEWAFNKGARPDRNCEKPAVLGSDAEASDHGADVIRIKAPDIAAITKRRATSLVNLKKPPNYQVG